MNLSELSSFDLTIYIHHHLIYFQAEMTSIVLKKDVTMLDIQSTRMLGQVGFLAKVWEFPSFIYLFIYCIFIGII